MASLYNKVDNWINSKPGIIIGLSMNLTLIVTFIYFSIVFNSRKESGLFIGALLYIGLMLCFLIVNILKAKRLIPRNRIVKDI